MSNPLDERRQGLEEEYFHRKNQEAIEKLRAQMKTLKEIFIEEVPIDTCDKCAGVWLDSGELEKLTQTDIARWFRSLWQKMEE